MEGSGRPKNIWISNTWGSYTLIYILKQAVTYNPKIRRPLICGGVDTSKKRKTCHLHFAGTRNKNVSYRAWKSKKLSDIIGTSSMYGTGTVPHLASTRSSTAFLITKYLLNRLRTPRSIKFTPRHPINNEVGCHLWVNKYYPKKCIDIGYTF